MTIKWADQYGTDQIYDDGPEMALMNVNGEQIGPFVYCGDFHQDAIRAFLWKQNAKIYGYEYKYGVDPEITFDRVRVMYANLDSDDFANEMYNTQLFLNAIEDLLKMPHSKVSVVIEADMPERFKKNGVAIFEGNADWLLSPTALSLYRLILRNGAHYNSGDPLEYVDQIIKGKVEAGQDNDNIYWKVGVHGLNHLIANGGIRKIFGDDIKKNYPQTMGSHDLHHNTGIVSFGESHSSIKKWFPHWQLPNVNVKAPAICHM